MTTAEVLKMLRTACDRAGGIRAWARKEGFSAPYVSDVLLGRRPIGPRILATFGLEAERELKVTYRKVRHVR